MNEAGLVVVTGATGRQGGAVTRALLRDSRRVRALTRKPDAPAARALAAAGADVVAADMDDPSSLNTAFAGADGVYSVQNSMISGLEGEARQGRNVGDAAAKARIEHFVYGSAGVGRRGTGVGMWEVKLDVEDHLRELGLPLTVLRPMAFMELMTDRDFFPPAGTWHVWPTVAGWDFQVPWLACHDLGVIAAKAFADPAGYIGRDLTLTAEMRSLRKCRDSYAQVMGHGPRRFPMPVRLFRRFAADTLRMWEWLRNNDMDPELDVVRTLHPEAMTVEAWLRSRTTAPSRV